MTGEQGGQQGFEEFQPPMQDAGIGTRFVKDGLTSGQRARWTLGGMVGRSPEMERVFLQVRYLAGHLRCVLIEGEAGTGKRLTAETLHARGPARERGFAAFPCLAFLSGPAMETGLRQAAGGTLYLHGVEHLQNAEQGRLLHLLQSLELKRHAPTELAGNSMGELPCAVILGAGRSLRELVQAGSFRADLHARLAAVQLRLPPLRDRREDIPMLLEHFLQHYGAGYGKRVLGIVPDALPLLRQHSWPENVAELEAAVSCAVLRCPGEWLRVQDVFPDGLPRSAEFANADPRHISSVAPTADPGRKAAALFPFSRIGNAKEAACVPMLRTTGNVAGHREAAFRHGQPGDGAARPSPQARERTSEPVAAQTVTVPGATDPNLDRAIQRHVRRVLAGARGNKLRAARLLGISRSTLYRLLEQGQAGGRAEQRV